MTLEGRLFYCPVYQELATLPELPPGELVPLYMSLNGSHSTLHALFIASSYSSFLPSPNFNSLDFLLLIHSINSVSTILYALSG